jgi:integrase
MKFDTVLDKHIEFKKTSVKSKEKIKDIRRYLGKFLKFVNKPMNKIEEEDIIKFLNSLEFSIGTINDIKTYIKVFVKWYYPDWSAKFRNLDRICKMQKPPQTYTAERMIKYEDIEKIVQTENNLQWKTYWLTLFYGGFRPSEASRLKWEEIFFEPEGVIIKVRTTKTNKDFIKALPKEAEQMLKELKQQSSSHLVFPSPLKPNSPLTTRAICQRLKRVSKKAIDKEVTPYLLRHSIATILYNDDSRPDDDVASQLGHNKSMKKTYQHLNYDEIKTRARKLWVKTKLSKTERDEFEQMKRDLSELKNQTTLVLRRILNGDSKIKESLKYFEIEDNFDLNKKAKPMTKEEFSKIE